MLRNRFLRTGFYFFLLLSASGLLPLTALAQDWALFSSGGKHYYFAPGADSSVTTLRVDSSEVRNDTLVRYVNFGQNLLRSNCRYYHLRNEYVRQSDNDERTLFIAYGFAPDYRPVRYYGDTAYVGRLKIALRAPPGAEWAADASDGLTGRVDSVGYWERDGQRDLVKYYSLRSADTVVSFALTKQHGLVDFRPGELDLLVFDVEGEEWMQAYERERYDHRMTLIGGANGDEAWGFRQNDFKSYFTHWRPGNVFYYETSSLHLPIKHWRSEYKDSVLAREETDSSITVTVDRYWWLKAHQSVRREVDSFFVERGLERTFRPHPAMAMDPGQYFQTVDTAFLYDFHPLGQVRLSRYAETDVGATYDLQFYKTWYLQLDPDSCRLRLIGTDDTEFSLVYRSNIGWTDSSTIEMVGEYHRLKGYNIDGEQTGEEWYVSRANKLAARPAFRLFPNPANDRLNIVLDQPAAGQATYAVRDLTGRTALSGELAGEALDVAALSSGAYLLELRRGGARTTEKFIITR